MGDANLYLYLHRSLARQLGLRRVIQHFAFGRAPWSGQAGRNLEREVLLLRLRVLLLLVLLARLPLHRDVVLLMGVLDCAQCKPFSSHLVPPPVTR